MNKSQNFVLLTSILGTAALSSHAIAQSSSMVPNSGAYLGLGLSANSTQYSGQQVQATGISTVTNTASGREVGGGTAGGPPVGVAMGNQSSIAPTIQAGYFQKLKDSSYLWGAKFSYSYMGGSTTTTDGIRIPQYGSYKNGTTFTGTAIADSYQKTINHQISFIPYFGKSFERSTVYFGVGPTISQVKTKINNLIGFADIKGVNTDISGSPQNFSSTQWVYGGAATFGGTYFLDKEWFLDFSYTYSMSQNKTNNYYSTYNNPGTPLTYSGSLIGSSTGTSTVQALGLILNKVF
jgi:hypothetical protein